MNKTIIITTSIAILFGFGAGITISSLDKDVRAATAPQNEGGHIPFTQKEVTPGVPESYIGTVGQCPFYEMAGEKGCYPPSDITCNADWSVCNPKAVEPVIVEAPVVQPPKTVTCNE